MLFAAIVIGALRFNRAKYLLLCSSFTTLWANSADNKLMSFFLIFQKTGSEISCKLSPYGDSLHEMSDRVLGKIRIIYFKTSSAENFTQHTLR